MRFFFIFFLISISSYTQQYTNNNSFELNGVLSNKVSNGKKIYLNYTTDNVKYINLSTDIINNKFVFKGQISFPIKAFISNSDEFLLDGVNSNIMFLEPKKMVLFVNLYNFKDLKLKGSNTQDDYIQLEKIKMPTTNRRDSISKFYKIYYNEIQNTNDSILKNKLKDKINILNEINKKINITEVSLETNFIKKNPSSYISVDNLQFRLSRNEISLDLANSLFNDLSKDIRDSEPGKKLSQTLENFEANKIGSVAPDFTVHDIDNNNITLSSFRSKKFIIIDFWASWCGPCKEDLPLLKSLYNKYSEKGLEIISISKDKNPLLWKNAIKNEEIQMWRHISLEESKNPIDKTYVVTGIPVKIIINIEGKIIGRWVGGGDKNRAEFQKMLSEILP